MLGAQTNAKHSDADKKELMKAKKVIREKERELLKIKAEFQ